MPVPRIFEGKLILVPGGIGGEDPCCCGPPVGPVSEEYTICLPCPETCPTVGGFVNPPSIELTVFDADYAGGNITWAGETWTPAQVQAGESRCVCPDTYVKTKYGVTPPNTSAVHKWIAVGLFFERFFTGIGNTDRGVIKHTFGVVVGYSIVTGFGFTSPFFAGSPVINYGDPVSATSVTTKSMPDVYFFSHLESGVLWTWTKGARW